MQMVRTGLVGSLAAATLLSAAAAAAQDAPATFADLATYRGEDRDQILVAGAEEEGTVVWYTSYVKVIADQLVAAFEEKYPGVTVEYSIATDQATGTRVITEYQAGLQAVDVITVSGTTPAIIEAIGVQAWQSPAMDEYPVGEFGRDADNRFVAVTKYPRTFAYNTNLVSPDEVPTEWEDLLAPRWKDSLVISTSHSMGPMIIGGLIDLWGRDRALEYIDKLGQQGIAVLPVAATAIASQVAAGEYDACYCAIHHIKGLQADGAPVAYSVLGDTLFAPVQTVQLAPNPPHPHAALLFADFIISAEGGAAVQQAAGYFPTNPLVAAEDPELGQYGLWVMTPERLDAHIEEWVQIMEEALE